MTDASARGIGGARGAETRSASSVSAPARPPVLSARPRSRLARLLVLKSAAEALLVVALAAAFNLSDLRANFSGAVESFDGRTLRGWVVDQDEPAAAVEVQLFIDGRFAQSRLAGPQLSNTESDDRREDARHSFVFSLDPAGGGGHEARVYAVRAGAGGVRRTLTPVGRPLRLGAEPNDVE